MRSDCQTENNLLNIDDDNLVSLIKWALPPDDS